MKAKFCTCRHCGNTISMVEDHGVPVQCCGEAMHQILPGKTDGAQEKHVPVCETSGNKVMVTVGSVEHPMTPEHYIQWICLMTNQGCHYKFLSPTAPPKACFLLCEGELVEEVYAHCNLHSLWKA